jgi:opacity protein-like surface antigen
MKKGILAIIMVVLCVVNTNAQKTKLGITAGYQNLGAKVSLLGTSETDNASGYYIGFFADFSISGKVKIQPELSFVQAIKNSETSNSLFLPIMVKYYVNEKFYLQAGPALDYIIEDNDFMKKLGFGLGLGAGFEINEKFFISSKYTFGLNNRLEDFDLVGFEGFPIDLSDIEMKLNYFQIGLGYKF